MSLPLSITVSLVLLAGASGLMVWHVRAWRAVRESETDRQEYDYRRRQFRRRMQTSAMLALLAAALGVSPLVANWPKAAAVYTGVVLLLVCWVFLLAAVDALATRLHFGRVRHDCLVERAKLQAQLRKIQAARSNGKPPGRPKQVDGPH